MQLVRYAGKPEYVDPSAVFAEHGLGYTWENDHYVRKLEGFGIVVEKDVFIGALTVVVRGSWRNTVIGEGTKIGNLCNVGHNSNIGKNCLLSPRVTVEGSVDIGDNTKVGTGAIFRRRIKVGKNVEVAMGAIVKHDVPDGARVESDGTVITKNIGRNFKHGKHFVLEDGVTIGDDFSCKHFVEIRRGSIIGNNVQFGSRITLAENTNIEDNVIIKYGFVSTDTRNLNDPMKKIPCTVKRNSRIGANVTLMPGVTVGENCKIGANNTIYHDLPDGTVVKNRD